MSHQPTTRQTPTQIAPETFVIHDHFGDGTAPVMVPINSMVIRGSEPIVVDTGYPTNRERFLADVFGLVEPEDIRWVFITHDDIDHTGNMAALMEAAPNATLIVDWFMVEGAVRPPVYDSPTTRGLFDPRTGVYWASDAFASPMATLATNAEQLDRATWIDGMAMFSQYVAPWHEVGSSPRSPDCRR